MTGPQYPGLLGSSVKPHQYLALFLLGRVTSVTVMNSHSPKSSGSASIIDELG